MIVVAGQKNRHVGKGEHVMEEPYYQKTPGLFLVVKREAHVEEGETSEGAHVVIFSEVSRANYRVVRRWRPHVV